MRRRIVELDDKVSCLQKELEVNNQCRKDSEKLENRIAELEADIAARDDENSAMGGGSERG